MKHKVDDFNSYNGEPLKPVVAEILNVLQTGRNFNVEDVIEAKLNILNKYLGEYGIDSAVVCLSGGIDSAVVYALLMELKNRKESNLKDVVALTLPYYKSSGANNQKSTVKRSEELVARYDGVLNVIELSGVLDKLMKVVKGNLLVNGSTWSEGQLVSYLRTPTYYYTTSLLNDEGKRAVVVGTTNKDEGAYLGYFGKASDGLVDIQLISDLHKSEVYKIAEYLKLPDSIINAVPTGDMHDNRADEEVFGAPYDFVELFLLINELDSESRSTLENVLDNYKDDKEQYERFYENLERLHSYNKHKYLGCSPAVHLDVLPYKIKGGWKYFNYE